MKKEFRSLLEDLPLKPYPHDEDAQLREELRVILQGLPAGHPAVRALEEGWATAVVWGHLRWADDRSLIEAMQRAYEAWRERKRSYGAASSIAARL